MPDDALLAAAADGSLATDAGFATQLDRVFADPRTRQTLWQFWNEWLRLETFTGFASERPAFMALAAGENLGVAGHDHYGDMVQELRDLTELFTWTRRGDAGDLLTTDLSVTRSGDLAHLYGVTGLERQRRLPALHQRWPARRHLATRGAAGVQPRADQPLPPRRVRAPLNPVRPAAAARSQHACRPARSIRRRSPTPRPPASATPAKIDGNQSVPSPVTPSSATSATSSRASTPWAAIAPVRQVFDEQTGALLAVLPIDSTAWRASAPDDTHAGGGTSRPQQRVSSPAERSRRACRRNYFRYALRREPDAPTSPMPACSRS